MVWPLFVAAVVNVLSSGWDAVDATECLQNAIDASVRQVVVENSGSPWRVKSLRLRSGVEIVFKDGTVLELSRMGLVLNGVTNVAIRGEGNVLIKCSDDDSYGLSVNASRNISVSNLHFVASGGLMLESVSDVQLTGCSFKARKLPALSFRERYSGRMDILLDRCVFDARGGSSHAVSVFNSGSTNPFGGIQLRYVDLLADADQSKLRFDVGTGSGVDDILGNVDVLFGGQPRDIIPFVAFLGLPERDASLDATLVGGEGVGSKVFFEKMEMVWDGVFRHNYEPKTSVLLEAPIEELPSPDMIAAEKPNMCGWGTGMEDGLLSGGPMLLAALARWDASGGADTKAESAAKAIFKGLVNCAEVSGIPGFLARAIHPGDMKSFYPCSSRDQYTLFVYSFWRTYSHPLAERLGWRPVIERILAHVAAYCRRTVTRTNGWQLARVDGRTPLVCKMWTDDTVGKQDGRGSVDYGDIYPHEVTRLPMIYLAAWSVTGDAQWKHEYEKYVDDAIRMNERPDPASERAFALMQMQVANRLIYDVEKSPVRKEKLLKIMQGRAKWVTMISSPRARMDQLFASKHKFHGRETGERILVQALCPRWVVTHKQNDIFRENVMRFDLSVRFWFPPTPALWYYWEYCRGGKDTNK